MKRAFVTLLKVAIYSFCLSASFLLAYNVKYNFLIPYEFQKSMWITIGWCVSLKIVLLIAIGEFKGIFSYFRLPDLFKIIVCLNAFSIFLLIGRYFSWFSWIPNHDILFSDLLFSILFIFFFRTSLRIINTSFLQAGEATHRDLTKVAIIGTNEIASQVVSQLKSESVTHMQPVVVLDDQEKYYGRTLHGVPVAGKPELLTDFAHKHAIDAVIFISGNLSRKRLIECAELAKSLQLKIFNIPSLSDFLDGRTFVTQLRPLEIEDFLKREPIRLNIEACEKEIQGQVVCVTGAGGSIGSELSLQIAQKHPKTLVLMDHSEYNLFKIQQILLRKGYGCEPVLLNIAHQEALRACLEKFRPDSIFHAAAYKHVPLLESQALVAVQNNLLGTGWLACYASELHVRKFVLISTDKAVRPVNNMGATKRICEMFCKALQQKPGNQTLFMAVRFGNVLGSAGSVLPIFKEQIASGGPVTVTHPDMTRFFMTIPEAVSLILEAFCFSEPGKTYVLDMGQPVKILDLAKQMIRLSGIPDIPIVFTGIRPGEKIHEELSCDSQKIVPTSHPLVNAFQEDSSYVTSMRPIQDYLCEIQTLKTNADALRFIRTLLPKFKEQSNGV